MDDVPPKEGLLSFSPGWGKPEVLEATLVGRKELVDRLEELVLDGAGGPNKHQRLVVGVRGSGKTHITRVLHNRLWTNTEVKKRLLIVYLIEDELGVSSFLDLVVRMLRAIVRWYPEHAQLAVALEELHDLPFEAQKHRAVHLLLQTAANKDVLLIMENLGLMFDQTKGFGREGQQELRDLVQQHPRFMIFASAQALDDSIKDARAPFYGFFKVTHLRRLTLEEAMSFLMAIASATDKPEVVRFLNTPTGRARMKTIFDYTGGNHRLLVTFYEFLATSSLARLSLVFMKALNPLKPYYQEQMRSLSAQQQKIVQYLSLQRIPQAVKDIARGCLAAPNTISSQLKDLLDRNFVSRNEDGRESRYEITETLFRICYEAELQQEGAPVRLFVDFLASLYTSRELQLRHHGFQILAQIHGKDGVFPFAEECRIYEKAISLHHPELDFATQGESVGELKGKDHLHSFFREMEEAGAYHAIVEFGRYLKEDKDAVLRHTEASAFARLGDSENAKASALEALKKAPNDFEAHLLLGRLLGNQGRYEEALAQFQQATRIAPGCSDTWRLMGKALAALSREEEAEVNYRKSLKLQPDNAKTLREIGQLLLAQGRYVEALPVVRQLNQIVPESSNGWALTGMVLERLNRNDEVEPMYRKSLELNPDNAVALQGLGVFVGNTGRHEEALTLFQRLNQISPEYSEGWRFTGNAKEALGLKDEAERAYGKSLELNAENIEALLGLGQLARDQGSHAESLDFFQKMNKAAPTDPRGWALTAVTLHQLSRLDEAVSAYRRAIELDPKNVGALKYLTALLFLLGHEQEAAQYFKRATPLGANRADLVNARGEGRRLRGEYKRAMTDYEEAISLDPRAALPHFNMVSALLALGKFDEALLRLPRAIEIDKASQDPKGGLLVQSLQENCQALFVHSPNHAFSDYLEPALEILDGADYLNMIEKALAPAVFAILKDHQTISEERFEHIVRTFEQILGKRIETRVAVQFLRVGIDYFKKKNRKALLRLAREEREVFCRELGVEAQSK